MNPPERKLISNSRLQNKPCITNSCNQKKTHLYASPHTDNEMTKKLGKKKVMCLTLFPPITPKVLVIKSCAGSFYKAESEPVGLFRVHESLILLITILGSI